jgi:toxin YhaV
MAAAPHDSSRINGWLVLLHPLFAQRYQTLREEALRLKQDLSDQEWRQHPTVKLVAALRALVLEIVPRDPNAPEFRLHAPLQHVRRATGKGLPPRYRLFWVCSTQARAIIFLYLNDTSTLRKEGVKTDPYVVFARLVQRGDIGANFAANLETWKRASGETT